MRLCNERTQTVAPGWNAIIFDTGGSSSRHAPRPKPSDDTRLPVASGTPAHKDETTDISRDLGPGAVNERHSYVDSRDRGGLTERARHHRHLSRR